MKKQNDIHQGSNYEKVPSLLLDNIARLNAVLAKHRNNKNRGSLAFYEDILRTLRLAYLYTQQTRWLHDRNTILEANIGYLAHYNNEIRERLDEFEVVNKLKQKNRMHDVSEPTEMS